jgi:ArsR family transcriptional regulator
MTKNFKSGCPACFKSLSTKVRSAIVNLIQDRGELAVMDVVGNFKLTQPTISYHLAELEKSGILKSETRGRQVFYKVNPSCPYDKKQCILK